MKTYSTKISDIKRESHTIDASGQILGRLATRIAGLLMGKHKTMYERHLDTGDIVVVFNAEKIKTSGKKAEQKVYPRHSGYPGGFKSEKYEQMMEKHPERIIEYAVKGMLPQNKLRARMMKRLRIYAGTNPVLVKAEISTDISAKVSEEKKEGNVNG
jgi:large subunit ribosomal protein L13